MGSPEAEIMLPPTGKIIAVQSKYNNDVSISFLMGRGGREKYPEVSGFKSKK